MGSRILFGIGSAAMGVGVLSYGLQPRVAHLHCQVPCGIFDDKERIKQMLEHTTTIKKAMGEINSLAGKGDAQSANQLTRWINEKENHASKIMTCVSEYFFAQRIKEVEEKDSARKEYLDKLADHHKVLRQAMSTKQTVDKEAAEKLEKIIKELGKKYYGYDS